MLNILFIALFVYGLILLTWTFYIACMQLKRLNEADRLHPVAKVNGYVAAGIMLTLDFVLATLLIFTFLDIPHELLTSSKLKRLKEEYPKGWRGKAAAWLCEHLLNQFDPSGDHC